MSNDTYILKNVYMPIVLVNAVMKWSDEVASSLRQVLQVWSICLCVATNLHNINSIWWLILVKRYIDPSGRSFFRFCSIKGLGTFLLSPAWDASPSLNSLVPIYTPERREALWELGVLKTTQHNVHGQGSNPTRSIRTHTSHEVTRPPLILKYGDC